METDDKSKSRFTEELISVILQDDEAGGHRAKVCRKYGIAARRFIRNLSFHTSDLAGACNSELLRTTRGRCRELDRWKAKRARKT